MDKIKILQSRYEDLQQAGKNIRETIKTLIDEDSFVELSTYSFSSNDFYGITAEGEGVVTGFATIGGYPFYIAAQNYDVLSGGVSKAGCDKIIKCMDAAEKNETPIIYILQSHGVRIGEGVAVLEGLSSFLLTATRLRGIVPQFCIVNGDLYGQLSILPAVCDFTYSIKNKSVLCVNSPFVISAKSEKNIAKDQIGSYDALKETNIFSFNVENVAQIKDSIYKIIDLLPEYGTLVNDCEDLNKTVSLKENITARNIVDEVFDKNSSIEVGTGKELRCLLGRIGGISCAVSIFDSDNAIELTPAIINKLNNFAEFVAYHKLPYITFVNNTGIKSDIATNNSTILKDISLYIEIIDNMENAKISVVYKSATGLGYTLFAAKNMGYDYTCAFADAKIALFDSQAGAEIEFNGIDKDKIAAKYADENSDPFNAAKGGFIDSIIQPCFIRQHLIASLQMLIR